MIVQQLNLNLPDIWSHRNPVDVLGDARSKRYAKAVEIVIRDPGVDAVLAILTPQAMTNAAATARELVNISEREQKPIVAAFLGGASMTEGIEILGKSGIPAYRTPEQAIQAFMILVSYARNLEELYETPREIPLEFTLDRREVRREFLCSLKEDGELVSEETSKLLLEKYGIATSLPRAAESACQAAEIANKTGYPVVMKIDSPDISHKSDIGGVILGLKSEAEVREAFSEMIATVSQKVPSAKIRGVTIQPMIETKGSVEMLLGSKRDPVFGSVILAGMGGTRAELFNDRAIGLPPLNERLARALVEPLKVYQLLKGYRGEAPKNISGLLETIIRLSYLIADFPEIRELDINPLLVTEKEIVALDARIIFDRSVKLSETNPYSHLALQPYPEKYTATVELSDGTSVLLRPIKPEDEPMWLKLLGSCSRESIYSRFRYMFHWDSHDVATRYCYIDYSREIAIVAEIGEGETRQLLGVGRLISDPDHETAEYAVLISDKWQHKDLGKHLTSFCLDIARDWGLKRFVAQTTTDNSRMISVFKKHDFQIEFSPDSTVEVEKEL